jgi:hypothetical protein
LDLDKNYTFIIRKYRKHMVHNPEARSYQENSEPDFAKALASSETRERKSVTPQKVETKRSFGLRPLNAVVFLAVLMSLIPAGRASAQEVNQEVNAAFNNPVTLVTGGENINHKDDLTNVDLLLALNNDLLKTSQVDDDDEPLVDGDDDDAEIGDAFDGDLAAFAFEGGEFSEIDEVLQTILETVDAELLEGKQVSFDLTWNGSELVTADGSPFEIPDEVAQAALFQMVENLPEGSVTVDFTIDGLSVDSDGNVENIVLGFTVTHSSEIPSSGEEGMVRTDVKYLDGENQIQVVEGTPVPNGVVTDFTLTTAGEISSALAERGITLDVEDFETVLVETMTRDNGGTPEEIIIRVIYGDLTGEPSVITPTSAEITIGVGVNIRTERSTSSPTRDNTSPFEAATFADFPVGTDLTGFVLNNDGKITFYDGTYNWIVIRNSAWTPGQNDEPRLLYAAFADTAVVNPATGTPMPNLGAENAAILEAEANATPVPVRAPDTPDNTDPNVEETPPPVTDDEEEEEQVPLVITPEALGLPSSTWEVPFAPTAGWEFVDGIGGPVLVEPTTVTMNPDSIIYDRAGNIIPLGVVGVLNNGTPNAELAEILDERAITLISDTNTNNDSYIVLSARVLQIYSSSEMNTAIVGFTDSNGSWREISVNIHPTVLLTAAADGDLVRILDRDSIVINYNNGNQPEGTRIAPNGYSADVGDHILLFLTDFDTSSEQSVLGQYSFEDVSEAEAYIDAIPPLDTSDSANNQKSVNAEVILVTE